MFTILTQVLLIAGGVAAVSRPNIESNIKVVKLQIFVRVVSKISEFLIACK